MLELVNLSRTYRTDNVETMALRNINLTIEESEFLAIMGPSGCGKSTLLSILAMLDSPTAGEYRVRGENVAGYSEAQLAQLRKSLIGIVFQNFNLIDELSVAQNVKLALAYHGVNDREQSNRTAAVLERVELKHRAGHLPRQLSGGQQQRAAVARALVSNPKLILADEPTGNLDSENGSAVMELLKSLNEAGTTVIMVTHSAEHAQYASRVVELFDGQLVGGQSAAA
jgi:putative ABC transport system ATP-binding protein